MNYEDWINNINILKKSNNNSIKDKIINENNNNLKEMLEPKIIELIKYRLSNQINKIINNLNEIFLSNDFLDLTLVTMKKDIKFTYELTNIKVLTDENRNALQKMIKSETDNIYDILTKEADLIDITGVLKLTIINNRLKWSD